MDVVGKDGGGPPVLSVRADKLASYRVLVSAPRNARDGAATPFASTMTDTAAAAKAAE